MNSATIHDVFRLALPAGSTLIVGQEQLGRAVSWACSLRPSPPAFPKLDGNEIALIDIEDLRRLDPQMRLERVIGSLREAKVAAVVVLGEVSAAAVQAATTHEIPVFKLPEHAQMVQVERTIIRLIVDREGYLAQRSTELQRELNQIALDGGGLVRITAHLAQFAQQPALMLQEDGQVAAAAGVDTLSEQSRQALLSSIPNITTLRSAVARADQHDSQHRFPFGLLPVNGNQSNGPFPEILVAPVSANDMIRGFCLILRPRASAGGQISSVETVAAAQGVAAAALEWAKQNAVDIAEERMRSTFVDELLASEISDQEAWIQRGKSLNYDLALPHAAWLIETHGIIDWPSPLQRFAEERGVNIPFSRRESGHLLFWPLENPKSARELKTVAHEFAERTLAGAPKATLVIGIGRPATTPELWVQSLQQASDSLRLGKEWRGSAVTYFGAAHDPEQQPGSAPLFQTHPEPPDRTR